MGYNKVGWLLPKGRDICQRAIAAKCIKVADELVSRTDKSTYYNTVDIHPCTFKTHRREEQGSC